MHRTLLNEPLIHFSVLAALLFLLSAIFEGDTREEIVVDAATQDFLLARQRDLLLSEPTAADLDALVASYITDEILVREAIKRGFVDSARIRALLVRNMRFFLMGDLSEPTEAELRAFYKSEKHRFESPPSFDLDHLFFKDLAEVPSGLAELLNSGADSNSYGDFDINLGRQLRFVDQPGLSRLLGPKSARQVFDLPNADSNWHGPLEAPGGTAHFVRITARNAPQVPAFETARDWIATEWRAVTSEKLMQAELTALSEGYRITIEPRETNKPSKASK